MWHSQGIEEREGGEAEAEGGGGRRGGGKISQSEYEQLYSSFRVGCPKIETRIAKSPHQNCMHARILVEIFGQPT